MSNENDPGHGHSVAAWTSVIIMLIAFVIGTFFFFLSVEWVVWASAGLLVVGAILWPLLSKLGFGEKPHVPAENARS